MNAQVLAVDNNLRRSIFVVTFLILLREVLRLTDRELLGSTKRVYQTFILSL